MYLPQKIPLNTYNIAALILIALGLGVCLPIVLESEVGIYWVNFAYPLYVMLVFTLLLIYFTLRMLVLAIRRNGGFFTFMLLLPLTIIILLSIATTFLVTFEFSRHVDTTQAERRTFHMRENLDVNLDKSYDIYRCNLVFLLCREYVSFEADTPLEDDLISVERIEEGNRITYRFVSPSE